MTLKVHHFDLHDNEVEDHAENKKTDDYIEGSFDKHNYNGTLKETDPKK